MDFFVTTGNGFQPTPIIKNSSISGETGPLDPLLGRPGGYDMIEKIERYKNTEANKLNSIQDLSIPIKH